MGGLDGKGSPVKLTGKGPLLGLSCFALPENVALEHLRLHGCTVTAAISLK